MHLDACISKEGLSPSENREAAMVWGQRMYFLGQMMVQEEAGHESMMRIQARS